MKKIQLLLMCMGVGMSAHAAVSKNQNVKNSFNISSTAFTDGAAIPSRYTCDGENISPVLEWSGEPKGTQSFALIVDDPDAPSKVWVHWVVYNIPATVKHLSVGADTSAYATGLTDFDNTQYGGPCPPTGTHRYRFTLYALDTVLPAQEKITKQKLLAQMKEHILGQATLVGTYTRSKS